MQHLSSFPEKCSCSLATLHSLWQVPPSTIPIQNIAIVRYDVTHHTTQGCMNHATKPNFTKISQLQSFSKWAFVYLRMANFYRFELEIFRFVVGHTGSPSQLPYGHNSPTYLPIQRGPRLPAALLYSLSFWAIKQTKEKLASNLFSRPNNELFIIDQLLMAEQV